MICPYCGEENCYCAQKLLRIIFSNLVGNKLKSVKVGYKEIDGVKNWAAYQKWVDEFGKKYYTVTSLPVKFISKEAFSKVEDVNFESLEDISNSILSDECILCRNEKSESLESEDGTRGDCLPRRDGLSDKKFRKKLDKELDEYVAKRDYSNF
jgi:hypothetical protein